MSRAALAWGLAGAGLLGWGGWRLWAPARKAGADAPAFRTAEAKRGPLRQTVREVGHLQPAVWVDVKSEISGRVAEALASIGDEVKAGQVLVRLDDRIPAQQLAQARIKVELARLTEEKQKRGLDRRSRLSGEGRSVISPEELEQARTDYDLAVVSRRDAESAAQTAEDQLKHTTILSPLDGLVIERAVNPGDVVIGSASAGAPTALMRVANCRRMEVVLEINEVDYPKVAAGQPVELRATALGDEVFRGKVVSVGLSGHADAKNKNLITYTVQAEVDDAEGHLRASMTATVDIITAERKDALVLPREAVVPRDGKPSVFRLSGGDGEDVAVKTGLQNDTEVEIAEGLKEGDSVRLGAWGEEDWKAFRESQLADRQKISQGVRRRGGAARRFHP